MTISVDAALTALVDYAVAHELISVSDRVWAINALLAALGRDDFREETLSRALTLPEILTVLCDDAVASGRIREDTVTYRDLFDSALMGLLTPRPGEVIRHFEELYAENPREATDWFYRLARDTNYIRVDRVDRDLKWSVPSVYGDMDITVNLSKPEKDPRAIAAAKLLPQSGYPRCLLCHENEGFAGNEAKPARQNLRQIPFDMAGTPWYLQYSPYVYYNEHCIALSSVHEPMKIDRSSFSKLLDFVTHFPHYFIGSNADLPIVGGSILSHDHMQGGRYSFAMERAGVEIPLSFDGYPDVEAGIVKWPMAVLRLSGSDRERIISLADRILSDWRRYSDPDAGILAETDGVPHNTVTPIARMRNQRYELDLVLRNNRTTEEFPLGIFHPHADLHHIKRENIGLIEVMGLAVLPARLKTELSLLRETVLSGGDPEKVPGIEKHAAWLGSFRDKYRFTAENTEDILRTEVGAVFVRVLEDAGVYKCTPDGRAAFLRFVDTVNEKRMLS